MLLIVSFPRSGNHLVRFLIEYLVGRTTLGCVGNSHDLPIVQNVFPLTPDILSHVRDNPIGQKAHTVAEIRDLTQSRKYDGVIFVRRDPLEAISANLPDRKKDYLGIERYRDIRRVTRDYYSLIDCVAATKMATLALSYEALVAPDPRTFLPALDSFIAFLGNEVDPTRADAMRADFPWFRNVSATGSRRSWGGIRSNGDPTYHQSRLSPRWLKALRREIRRYEDVHELGQVTSTHSAG